MQSVKILPSFSQQRQILGEICPLDTPFTVLLDTADKCNFKCFFCFRGNPEQFECGDYGKNELMSWETFTRAVEQLMEFPDQVKQIALSNHGEPLCNRMLPDMIAHIRDSGLTGRTSIHTNASLLTKSLADDLVRSGLGRMVISLEGLDADQYRKNCGVAINFERLVENVAYLYGRKEQMELSIKIIDSALEGRSQQEFFDIFTPIADRVFVEQGVPLWEDVDFDKTDCSNKYGERFRYIDICPLVFHSLLVLPSGVIYPCTRLSPPFKLGSVYDMTLKEAWNSEKRRNLLRDMLKVGRGNISVCKQCYIPQNTVYSECDIMDDHREQVLDRLEQEINAE